MAAPGGVPERPKGTGCKPVGSAYGGSNPPAPIPIHAAARPDRGRGITTVGTGACRHPDTVRYSRLSGIAASVCAGLDGGGAKIICRDAQEPRPIGRR